MPDLINEQPVRANHVDMVRMTIGVPRLVCFAVLGCCFPRAGYGQTNAEEAYLRARREAEHTFSDPGAGESGPALLSDHRTALADLERRLRPIMGPVSVRGFPQAGKISIESLFDGDADSGILDGLKFQTADHRTEMVVTTHALMSAWLGENPDPKNIPRTVEEAVRSPDISGSAFFDNAGVYRYADLPIPDASRQGIASATLILRAQDDGVVAPDMVLLSVVRGDRIFMIQSRTAVVIHTLPVCSAPINAAFKAAADSGGQAPFRLNGDSLFAAYRSCYGEHLASIPGIDRIIRQVSALAAALPPR